MGAAAASQAQRGYFHDAICHFNSAAPLVRARKVARGSHIHSGKLQPAVKAIFAIIHLFVFAMGCPKALRVVTYGVVIANLYRAPIGGELRRPSVEVIYCI